MGNSTSEERATAHLKIIIKIITMKINKTIATVLASMLMLVICFTASNSFAQTKTKQ